jgi:hypothetical protein
MLHKTVHATYQTQFGGESQELNLSRYPKANRLTKPITQEEILKAYSSAKNDSAAGPDGIDLKKVLSFI